MRRFDRIALLHVGEGLDVIHRQVAALDLVHAQAPPDLFVALVRLLDQLIEIVETLLAPLHQTRMLNRREDLAAVMRHALIGDINADRIELAARMAGGIKHITHHRIHVRAEPAFPLNVRRRIVLKKDASLVIDRRTVSRRELSCRIGGLQRGERGEQERGDEGEGMFHHEDRGSITADASVRWW